MVSCGARILWPDPGKRECSFSRTIWPEPNIEVWSQAPLYVLFSREWASKGRVICESCNCRRRAIGMSGYDPREESPRDSRSDRAGQIESGAFTLEVESTAGANCVGLSQAGSHHHSRLVRCPESERTSNSAEYDLPDDACAVRKRICAGATLRRGAPL